MPSPVLPESGLDAGTLGRALDFRSPSRAPLTEPKWLRLLEPLQVVTNLLFLFEKAVFVPLKHISPQAKNLTTFPWPFAQLEYQCLPAVNIVGVAEIVLQALEISGELSYRSRGKRLTNSSAV